MNCILRFLGATFFFVVFSDGAPASELPSARLLVSNPAPYVGEEIVVTLEVRTSPRPPGPIIPIWPTLDSSAIADLPTPPSRMEEESELVLVQAVRRSLRPLRTGRLLLGAAGVSLAGQTYQAPPVELRILPLPERNRPNNFAGAIGQIHMHLEGEGRGSREIRLIMNGNTALESFPEPVAELGNGERLIPLDDSTVGDAPLERTRTIRYLYIPGDNDRGRIVFRLPVFDPLRKTYVIHQAGIRHFSIKSGQGAAIAIGIIILVGLILLYRQRLKPRTIDEAVERVIMRAAHRTSRAEILALLVSRQADAHLVSDLTAYWAEGDRQRFAQGSMHKELSQESTQRNKRLLRQLNRLGRKAKNTA